MTVGLELRRIAVELQMFPFEPRRLVHAPRGRKGIRTTRGYLHGRSTGRWGALVYFDILARGGVGSRRDVLGEVETVIGLAPVTGLAPNIVVDDMVADSVTARAAIEVASLRFEKSPTVGEPELPIQVGYYYEPTLVIPTPVRSMLEDRGARLAQKLLDRSGAWALSLYLFEEDLIREARVLWHDARLAYRDDSEAWMAEQAQVQEFAKVLRFSRSSFMGVAVKEPTIGLRHISLDD